MHILLHTGANKRFVLLLFVAYALLDNKTYTIYIGVIHKRGQRSPKGGGLKTDQNLWHLQCAKIADMGQEGVKNGKKNHVVFCEEPHWGVKIK